MNIIESLANYKKILLCCDVILSKEKDIPWCYKIKDIYIDNFDLINIDISYWSGGYELEASYSYDQEVFKDFYSSQETS